MTKRFPGILLIVVTTFLLVGPISGLTATSASAAVTPAAAIPASGIPAAAGSVENLVSNANKNCLNGYTGSAHAEVTMTPCNTTDGHMQWQGQIL